MQSLSSSVATAVAVITAMGALGVAAAGLVDATKAFWGGVSKFGLATVFAALKPFEAALNAASATWKDTVRANWVNGVAKEDQKTAAKTLIRLGLSGANVAALANAGGVSQADLTSAIMAVASGAALTTQQADVFGRFNAAIDAKMDAGFERGDQQYRNASKVAAGVFSILLALWAAYLTPNVDLPPFLSSSGAKFGWAFFVGLLAVPIAPITKDLASSLQTAASAVGSLKS